MFMTIPKVVVGELAPPGTQTTRPNAAYAQVRSAYGAAPLATPLWTEGMVSTFDAAASDITADVVADLLSDLAAPHPAALVDCRSATMLDGPAPTYRLAARCGLRRVTCWSLSGLGGTEVGEALLQVRALGLPSAVISAVQAIQFPDTRVVAGSYLLGDAAAAIMVSDARPSSGFSWRVCGCTLAQLPFGESVEPHHVRALAAEACKRAGLRVSTIRWWVAQRVSAGFLNCVDAAFLQQSRENALRPHPSVNFGCADVLATLALSRSARSGLGALVFAGRFGSLGLVVLDG